MLSTYGEDLGISRELKSNAVYFEVQALEFGELLVSETQQTGRIVVYTACRFLIDGECV